MKLENQHIIVVSNEPWGDIWFSKQNYAFELARKNKVIFVNPATRWQGLNLLKTPKITSVSNNLRVVNYYNYFPSINKLFFLLNDFLVSKRLSTLFRKNGFHNMILWTFDPFRLVIPKNMGIKYTIFHIVDLYQYTHWGEKMIEKNANVCVFVSNEIKTKFALNAKRKIVIPHAISSDEFIVEFDPEDVPNNKFGLYVGNIDERLDFDYLESIIHHFSFIPFVFVGAISEVDEAPFRRIFVEKKYQNIVLLGAKPFKQLKNYISASTFCFAYMKNKPWNKIAHHKIFLYLALGKPVFSSVYSDYLSFSHALYMEDDIDKSISLMEQFIANGESEKLSFTRIKIAKSHSFTAALKKIEQFINE